MAVCAPYLTLMKEDAPQRNYTLRGLFNAVRYLNRAVNQEGRSLGIIRQGHGANTATRDPGHFPDRCACGRSGFHTPPSPREARPVRVGPCEFLIFEISLVKTAAPVSERPSVLVPASINARG